MSTTGAARTTISRWFGAVLGVASGLAASPAHAGPPAPTSQGAEALAEARFREASDAFDGGRVDEACKAFDASLHLFSTLGTLLNLALCHEKQGRTASAWLEFTYAAAWASDASQRERREFARQHAIRLERALVRVRVDGPPGPPVHLEVDGQPILDSSRAFPVFLDPGRHVIAASAEGRDPYETTVTVGVAPSEVQVVRIPALKEDVMAPSGKARGYGPFSVAPGTMQTLGWIFGSVGIASTGAAVYFGGDSLSKMTSDRGQAKTSEVLSLVLFGTGLTAMAAGAWAALWTPPAGVSTTARVYVVPQVAPASGGAAVIGTW